MPALSSGTRPAIGGREGVGALALTAMLAACADPVILEPTISVATRSTSRICDGSFTADFNVTATYPPPPGGPSVRGETTVSMPRANLGAVNLRDLSFSGLPVTFTQNKTEVLTVTGKLANPCQDGTLIVDVGVATRGAGNRGAISDTATIRGVPMIGVGPSADPVADLMGRFRFADALTCCVPPAPAGAYALTIVNPVNVAGVTVVPPAVNCIAGPNPPAAAAISGRLDPVNALGSLALQVTGPAGAPPACLVRTRIRPAPN